MKYTILIAAILVMTGCTSNQTIAQNDAILKKLDEISAEQKTQSAELKSQLSENSAALDEIELKLTKKPHKSKKRNKK
jgi:uncharacterized protein YcfL